MVPDASGVAGEAGPVLRFVGGSAVETSAESRAARRGLGLLAEVWPGTFVDEGSLRFQIAGLRKALGNGQGGARYITTIAGRGYCFVAPVARSVDRDDADTGTATHFPQANLPPV